VRACSLEGVIFAAFDNKSDNVQNAAAFALGNVACGAMTHYLPAVLELIRTQDAQRYLLLQALREIITRHSASAAASASFQAYVEQVTPLLLSPTNAESTDEGVRGMVAECLGRLAMINSAKIMPKLETLVTSTQPFTRAVIVTALRFTLPTGAGAGAGPTAAAAAAAAAAAGSAAAQDSKKGAAPVSTAATANAPAPVQCWIGRSLYRLLLLTCGVVLCRL
jgi:hypothetical protein